MVVSAFAAKMRNQYWIFIAVLFIAVLFIAVLFIAVLFISKCVLWR